MITSYKSFSYSWKRADLVDQALTHKSYFFENNASGAKVFHNEKLEFLGDAVIDLVLSEILFLQFPEDEEGGLSKKRASLVNEEVLAMLALNIGLDSKIKLGRGEQKTGGSKKPRLLASAYEAFLGALYLDGGYGVVKQLIVLHFGPLLEGLDPSEDYVRDYKTRSQEIIQKRFKVTPSYELIEESGPPHSPTFKVALTISGQRVSLGVGNSKKQAEQDAAKNALGGELDEFKL